MTFSLRRIPIMCLAFVAVFLFSCGSVRSEKSGTPDTARLEIVGDTSMYPKTVKVSIDGGVAFSAGVNDSDKNKHKYQYPIPTGSHDITITIARSSAVVVEKKIYASVGEVKVVELP